MFRLKVRLHGSDVKDLDLESGREYTFGRGNDCDVVLEDQPSISRVHFKVFEDAGQWTAQVVSKFGDINVAGAPAKTVPLEVGTVFKLAGYDFLFAEQKTSVSKLVQPEAPAEDLAVDMPMAVGQSEFRSQANLPAPVAPQPFEGSDEATRVMDIVQTGDPYVRIVEPSGREETVKLEGRKWIAGREEGSQILLNDRKASRRQFELVSSPQGNFVRDLGSSNGTQLNGMPLAPDELKPLRSGDVLQVGGLQIHFEVRDPHFERRLQVVPKEVMQSSVPAAQPVQYEMINYPVVQGPGGAVRVQAGGPGAPAVYEAPAWDGRDLAKEAKAKKIRFILIALIVGALGYYLFSDNSQPSVKKPAADKELSPQEKAFAKLPPAQQQFVKEAYILGQNLYIQGKGALAAEQFAKIHAILKEGYKDSHAMADECEAQRQQELNRLEVERQMAEAAQNKVIVTENLAKCKPIADRTYDVQELMVCLQPTIEREPMRPEIGQWKAMIEERVAQRDAKALSAKNYAAAVAAGEKLFKQAEDVEKSGDTDGAVDAYKKHYLSKYPDPKHLKEISRKKAGIIISAKYASIQSYMDAANAAYINKDYKTAINNINKVKGLDPLNNDAAELLGRINKEKDTKLREMWEDSVLCEGLGQIDQAKAKWNEILKTDHPDGIYYRRAKNKMKSLGSL